jgi:hypothetical protein
MKTLLLTLSALALCLANVSCSSCCTKKGTSSCCAQTEGCSS